MMLSFPKPHCCIVYGRCCVIAGMFFVFVKWIESARRVSLKRIKRRGVDADFLGLGVSAVHVCVRSPDRHNHIPVCDFVVE